MKHFATALTEIINRCFEGNRSTLAKKSGVSPSTIARFCSGEVEPTLDRLEAISAQLPRLDRKQLLLAAARDRVPDEYQHEIFGDGDAASEFVRAKLSPDLAAVIRYLENNALQDPLTASYLRRIGDWVGISSSAKIQPLPERFPSARVAEEPTSYKAKPAGKK